MELEKFKQRLIQINKNLIGEGEEVVKTSRNSGAIGAFTKVRTELLYTWMGKVKSFTYQLGIAAKPWQEILSSNDPKENSLLHVQKVLGTLKAIKYELENSHLQVFDEIVRGETLADLLEQAEHLLEKKYFLAAGVIGRAVLEEHLRELCKLLGLDLGKEKPTINDFNLALYKVEHYNKTKMKLIDTLASIGNDAAHNKEGLTKEDVKKLIADIPSVIDSTRYNN